MTRTTYRPSVSRAATLFGAAAFLCISGSAQIAPQFTISIRPASSILAGERASLDLPDAPSSSVASENISSTGTDSLAAPLLESAFAASPADQTAGSLPEAPRSERYPLPGQAAPVLTAGDKVRMGFTGAFSIYSIVGWVASAGYEQAINGSPNWGTDRGAFGQRLWCAAARATSENLFADSVLAPALHEDPRYYRLGSTHKFIPRLIYSATRSIITRSDSGATVPNLSQIFGNAAGSALTYAYYPESNRTAKDTAETFGGSIGGTALGDVIAEFFGGILFNHKH